MFVDASALVAILTDEPGGFDLAARLEAVPRRLTSGLAVYETVLAVRRKTNLGVAEAYSVVLAMLDASGIKIVAIAAAETAIAVEAFARFGKGRGHPAQMNMGDCFAYAVAKTNDVALLFNGDDFSKTDILSAAKPR